MDFVSLAVFPFLNLVTCDQATSIHDVGPDTSPCKAACFITKSCYFDFLFDWLENDVINMPYHT